MTTTGRLSQGAFDRPAKLLDPTGDQLVAHACSTRGLFHRHSLASHCDVSAVTRIAQLLKDGFPSAVGRRVWAVIVDTAERVLWRRTRPHIKQKPREIVAPFFAHVDPSGSVVAVGRVARVVTAPLRASPRIVLWSVGKPMSSQVSAGVLTRETAATLRNAAHRVLRKAHGIVSAITPKSPHRSVHAWPAYAFYCHQPMETLSGYVYWAHGVHFTTGTPNGNPVMVL